MERLDEIRSDNFAEDMPITEDMMSWTEGDAAAYFSSGGEFRPDPSANQLPTAAIAAVEITDAKGGSSAAASSVGDVPRACLVCVGDSITQTGQGIGLVGPTMSKCGLSSPNAEAQLLPESDGPGWTALLSRDYGMGRKADVVNRGFNGYTSRWLRDDLEAGLLGLPSGGVNCGVFAFTLMVGTNDHADARLKLNHGMHVPLSEYRANVTALVKALMRRYPDARPFLMTPPPCDGAAFDAEFLKMTNGLIGSAGRSQDFLLPYVAIVREVATAMGCTLIDLNQHLSLLANWKGLLSDGVHPNGKGHMTL